MNNIKFFIFDKNIEVKRKNQYYTLYDKKFDNMFIMPENICKYIDNINFNLKGYNKFDKTFINVNFILLLKD